MISIQETWQQIALVLGAFVLFGSAAGAVYAILGYSKKFGDWCITRRKKREAKKELMENAHALIETPNIRKQHGQRFDDIDVRLDKLASTLEEYAEIQRRTIIGIEKHEHKLRFAFEEQSLILKTLKPIMQLCTEIGSTETIEAATEAQDALQEYYSNRARSFE